METAIVVLLILSIFISITGIIVLFFVLRKRISAVEQLIPGSESFESIAKRISEADLAQRQSFEKLAGDLGKLSKATDQMLEVGKTISSLEDLLKPPKLRGGMGETLLEELLLQIFPADYVAFQHTFKNGETVDAIIDLAGTLIPVDAKFPLEDFRRLTKAQNEEDEKKYRKAFLKTIKKHINDISKKYIRPDEGTLDFALMYVPAENIYYETIIKDEEGGELFSYCMERRVVPVSPNSFYAYLQVIVRGLKGMKIEEQAKEILAHLARLHSDSEKFREDFDVVGRHLNNARNKFEEADRRLGRFEDKLLSVGEAEEPMKLPEEIEK